MTSNIEKNPMWDFTANEGIQPPGLKCKDFKVPHHEAMYLSNPMKEFVHPTDTTHVDLMHKLFRQKYKIDKKDELPRTFHKKKQTFRDNLRYIHSMNRRQLSFKLKVNHFAEYTLEEMRRMRGRLSIPWAQRVDNDSKIFDTQAFPAETPKQKDWRLYGAVTSVKDQSRCGSCWSFGSTGTVEGQYFLKTGRLVRLSEQNLMDCSWGFSNQGCDGGIESEAFKYIKKHGIASDEEYGPYLAVDGFCHADQVRNKINITGQVHIKSGDQHALRVALAHVGPIDVGIDSSPLSFTFYSHGVYYEEKCGNTEGDLDHAVLAVGYGTLHGKDYWLVKNSWSTLWGDEGYILMSTKHNNCGVATDANFVTM